LEGVVGGVHDGGVCRALGTCYPACMCDYNWRTLFPRKMYGEDSRVDGISESAWKLGWREQSANNRGLRNLTGAQTLETALATSDRDYYSN